MRFPSLRLPKDWDSDKHVAVLKRGVKGGDTLDPLTVFWTGNGWTCIDGHHRAEAAKKAGIKEVPVNLNTVSPEIAERLKDEAAMARAERMNRC